MEHLVQAVSGVEAEQRRSLAETQKIFKGLTPLFQSGDQAGMQKWVKSQRKLFASRLPDVDGNSVLMALIKTRDHFQAVPAWALTDQQQAEAWNTMLKHWRWLIAHIAQQATAKQLNLEDLKNQTPLMLMAEEGDAELVATLLKAGADPDLQDIHGMTALHSACKSYVDACVDALLNHPCKLTITTHEKRSALHTASWAGHVHAVKRLSQLAPALVNERDIHGQTPLEMAEDLSEHPDKLKALAQERARSGKRCATVSELKEIVQVLEAAMATANEPQTAETRMH